MANIQPSPAPGTSCLVNTPRFILPSCIPRKREQRSSRTAVYCRAPTALELLRILASTKFAAESDGKRPKDHRAEHPGLSCAVGCSHPLPQRAPSMRSKPAFTGNEVISPGTHAHCADFKTGLFPQELQNFIFGRSDSCMIWHGFEHVARCPPSSHVAILAKKQRRLRKRVAIGSCLGEPLLAMKKVGMTERFEYMLNFGRHGWFHVLCKASQRAGSSMCFAADDDFMQCRC